MTTQRARRVLFIAGLVCGAGLMGGFVAAVLIVLASGSGAGWLKRHQLKKGDV